MWLDSKAVNCPQKWGNFNNYRVGEAISRIARSILRKGILNNSQEAKEILTEIQQHGIKKDRKVSIRTLAELEAVQKLVEGVGYRAERQVGGDRPSLPFEVICFD